MNNIRKISVPVSFFEQLSLPCKFFKISKEELHNFTKQVKNTVIISAEDFYNIQNTGTYYEPKIIKRFQNKLLVEYDGFIFVPEELDRNQLELFSLKDKADELDKLKKSLSNIKTVLGEVK